MCVGVRSVCLCGISVIYTVCVSVICVCDGVISVCDGVICVCVGVICVCVCNGVISV